MSNGAEAVAESEPANGLAIRDMRSLTRKWVRQAGSLRFLESIRKVQFKETPACDCCTNRPDRPGEINILGSCGHIICEKCMSSAHIEQCAVEGCTASKKEFEVFNGEEIGRPKSACDAGSNYGSSKLDKLVEIIQTTPDEDRVLLFIQFPDIIELACKALELAGITYQQVTGAKHALFQQNAKFLAELNQHKVLILNLGTETAAGL